LLTQLEDIKVEITNLNQKINQIKSDKTTNKSSKDKYLEAIDDLSKLKKDNKKLKEELQRYELLKQQKLKEIECKKK